EDGIRDFHVTGVQTCALPIYKAAALGVNFSEASALISGALGSSFVGKFTNQGRVQSVWVQADAPYRMTIDDVLKLNARNSEGKMVPLSAFVNQTTEQGPVQIVRYNSYESVRISGGPAPGSTSGEAMIEMEDLMKQLPSGLGVDWTGLSYQERQAAGQSGILMGLAVLVVFMLLAAL